MFLLMLAALLLVPLSVRAEQLRLHYDTYAGGLHVLQTQATLDLGRNHYSLEIDYETAGLFGMLNTVHFRNRDEGVLADTAVQPLRVRSQGVARGEKRRTEIDYEGGQPLVRALLPEEEREKVAPELARNTLDAPSALVQLIRLVNATGRCDTALRTYDGRRLSALQAWTIGTETLPPSKLSMFAGRALHCAFEGHLLAGFKTDEPRERQAKPQHGGAWFAAIVPGGMLVPVRITFATPWFGEATMLLDGAG